VEPVPPGVLHRQPGQALHHGVDEPGVRADGFLAGSALDMHGLQRIEAFSEDGTEEFQTETSPILDAGGARLGAPGPAKQLERHDNGKPNSPL
jgi:hypothetical protein